MAFIIHDNWVSGQAYAKGDQAFVKGVVYQALKAVSSTTSPTLDGVNWRVSSVTSIEDLNSLVEAIRLQLNVTSKPEINDSIPMFIQLAEDSFEKRLRPPVSRKIATVTLDSDGKFEVPGDLVQVINLRVLEGSSEVTWTRQHVEIVNADYEQFREIRAYVEGKVHNVEGNYDSPVFWFDNKHFWIAPQYGEGTTLELVYNKNIPKLGSKVNITNGSAGGNLPLNSAGQTSAEWVVAATANTTDNFVQDVQTVLTNWYLSSAPQLLLFGALLRAKSFISDDEQISKWEEMYVAAELELQDFIETFESSQAQSINLGSAYLR